MASVTAIESKLYKCLKAVLKAAQASVSKTESSSKQIGQQREITSTPTTPTQYQGPTTMAAGPFKGRNGKLIQCWHCEGWEHTMRECLMQRNLNWRELSGAANPPNDNMRPAQNK